MKTLNILIMSFLSVFIITNTSCRKNIELQPNPFEIEIDYSDKDIMLNKETEIRLDIKPDHFVSTTEYSFSYILLKGEGYLIDRDSILEKNKTIKFEELTKSLKFIPTDIGDIEIKMTFKDNKEISKECIIEYYSYYSSDMNFVAIPQSTSANINTPVEIQFILNEELKSNITYKMTFQSNGAGTFKYNGVEYYSTQEIIVEPGVFTGSYTGTDIQTHNITFFLSNDNLNPVIHSQIVNIVYVNSDFNIVISPETKEIYPELYANYILNIDGGGTTETTLKIQRISTTGIAEYKVDLIDYQSDFMVGIDITNKQDIKIEIKNYNVATEIFNIYITKNGVTKMKNFTLVTNQPPFTISTLSTNVSNPWWDDNLTVTTYITSTYTEDIAYSYDYKILGTSVGSSVNTGLGTVVKAISVPDIAGSATLLVTVSNQYGYTQTKSMTITIRDPRPLATSSILGMEFWPYNPMLGTPAKNIIAGNIIGTAVKGENCISYSLWYYRGSDASWVSIYSNKSFLNIEEVMFAVTINTEITILKLSVKDNDNRWSDEFLIYK